MPTKTRESERVSLTGVGWKKPMSISAEKYDQISKAILTVLTVEPIKFTELAQRVRKKLPNFAGSVPWYTISVARDLEVQGKVLRNPKPVLYSLAGRPIVKEASDRTVKNKASALARKVRSAV